MTKSKSCLNTLLVALFISLPLFWQSVHAQTPDGETPANESVCNVLKGGTAGLYGLCVAYCEAHDAELISPSGAMPGLDPPNTKILQKYRNKMQPGDPDMPCIQSYECPCWSSAQLAELSPPLPGENIGFPNACEDDFLGSTDVLENIPNYSSFWQLTVVDYPNINSGSCWVSSNVGVGPPPTGQSLNGEEVDGCIGLLRQRASSGDAVSPIWSCDLLPRE